MVGSYYVAVYLPRKQKAEIEKVRSDLESKMEQEKAEQARITEEKQIADEAAEVEKQRLAEEEKQKADEEAVAKAQQQKIASATLKKCLDAAEANYKQKLNAFLDDCEYPSCDVAVMTAAKFTYQGIRDAAIKKCNK